MAPPAQSRRIGGTAFWLKGQQLRSVTVKVSVTRNSPHRPLIEGLFHQRFRALLILGRASECLPVICSTPMALRGVAV